MQQSENTVQLVTPIVRGETTIASVELIKPNAGALRGTRLVDLAGSDVDALIVAHHAAEPDQIGVPEP